MITVIKFFLLGVCTGVIALLVQIFCSSFFVETPPADTFFSEKNTGLAFLLIITLLEEAVRFIVLFFAHQKNIIPKNIVLPSISFGAGFAGLEILLQNTQTGIDISDLFLHALLLFLVHGTLTFLLLLGLKNPKQATLFVLCALVFFLHILYNFLAWEFARF